MVLLKFSDYLFAFKRKSFHLFVSTYKHTHAYIHTYSVTSYRAVESRQTYIHVQSNYILVQYINVCRNYCARLFVNGVSRNVHTDVCVYDLCKDIIGFVYVYVCV